LIWNLLANLLLLSIDKLNFVLSNLSVTSVDRDGQWDETKWSNQYGKTKW